MQWFELGCIFFGLIANLMSEWCSVKFPAMGLYGLPHVAVASHWRQFSYCTVARADEITCCKFLLIFQWIFVVEEKNNLLLTTNGISQLWKITWWGAGGFNNSTVHTTLATTIKQSANAMGNESFPNSLTLYPASSAPRRFSRSWETVRLTQSTK